MVQENESAEKYYPPYNRHRLAGEDAEIFEIRLLAGNSLCLQPTFSAMQDVEDADDIHMFLKSVKNH